MFRSLAGVASAAARNLGAHMEGRPRFYVILCFIVYLGGACLRAAGSKLWFDEIQTAHISSLPSVSAIWSFLKIGIDLNPPLSFILAGASGTLFGRDEVGLRLPSILAFWALCLFLYAFLRRRLPAPFALAGMVLPALTGALAYGTEARPYGLLLAFSGAALYAWQGVAGAARRPWSFVLLAGALAAALATSPMAVLLAVPFVAGEGVRTLQRRTIDWPVLAAFAAATPAALFLLRIRQAAGAATSWHNVEGWLGPSIATLAVLLAPALPALIVAALALPLLPRGAGFKPAGAGLPSHEIAALAGFVAIPLAAVPISTLGGPYFARYSVACVIGFAGLSAVTLARASARRPAGGPLTASILIGALAAASVYPPAAPPAGVFRNSSETIRPCLDALASGEPIAVQSPLAFLELDYYSSPELATRLYYLVDRSAAERLAGNMTFEVNAPVMKRWFGLRANVRDYAAFVRGHPTFPVVGKGGWLLKKLREDGARLTPVKAGGCQFYRVEQTGRMASADGKVGLQERTNPVRP